MVARPRLLDLFCGAGGAAVGYHRAGFDVVGVDIAPQPRYPFLFVQGDALEYVRQHGGEYDAIHASPPCQAYSSLNNINHKTYPDYLPEVRCCLQEVGIVWVIENVVGAPLRSPIVLCGQSFGLPLYRHRLFESSAFLFSAPHLPHRNRTVAGHGKSRVAARYNHFITACDESSPATSFRRSMECDWMTGLEASQAIPPVYSQFVGLQLRNYF